MPRRREHACMPPGGVTIFLKNFSITDQKYIFLIIIINEHFPKQKIPALFTPENRAVRLYVPGTNIMCENSAQFFLFFNGGFP
jgi:hypothetical protein